MIIIGIMGNGNGLTGPTQYIPIGVGRQVNRITIAVQYSLAIITMDIPLGTGAITIFIAMINTHTYATFVETTPIRAYLVLQELFQNLADLAVMHATKVHFQICLGNPRVCHAIQEHTQRGQPCNVPTVRPACGNLR